MREISFMKHTFLGLAAVALLVVGVGPAQAGFIQLASPGDLNPGDTTAIYTGNDGDLVASPYVLPAGGNTLTFTALTGVQFQRADEGTSWNGAFPDGTKLLWTLDPAANTGSAVSIGFSSALSEVGLQVQQDNPVSTTFTASVFNGANLGLTIMVTVPDSGTGAGNLGFIGFRATGADVITSIQISSVDSVDSSFNNDFAMGPVTFGEATPPPPAVPEPSSLVLGGISFVGLLACGILRKKPILA
jgi:hypothetical protein